MAENSNHARGCFRGHLHSDLGVFNQVFLHEEHNIPLDHDPHAILDLGANIGLASIHFATRFPDAKIIALEPEYSNFEMLKKNVAGFPNIKVVQAGIWHRDAQLAVIDNDDDKCAFQVVEATGSLPFTCEGVSITSIMRRFNLEKIDLMKVDIEGAEVELLGHHSVDDWISNVGTLMVELHERLRDGCENAFERAARKANNRYTIGEYEVLEFN